MGRTISIGIIILLLLAIPAHLRGAFVVFFLASALGQPLVWAFLAGAAAPPFILCRRWVDRPWSGVDMVLAGITVLPGIVGGMVPLLSGSRVGALVVAGLVLYAALLAGCVYLWRHPEREHIVLLDQRPATGREFISSYERMFEERGRFTPSDPLEFHLYHLARYWSRLVGFCRIMPGPPEYLADGSMAIAIRIANAFMDPLVDSTSPLAPSWNSYKPLAEKILHHRRVLLDDVEAASAAFDRVLAAAGYDPWPADPLRQTAPAGPEDLVDKKLPDPSI